MSAKRECHEQVVRVCMEARDVDTRRFETDTDLVPELVECMKACAGAAISALEQVIEVFDAGPTVDPGQTLITGTGVPVVDIAFIAHVYLRQRCERLVRLGSSPNAWLVLAESASLRRHILKSMVRVENAISVEMGLEPELGNLHDLDVSLASRDAYQRYIRSIRTIADTVDAGRIDILGALRLSATNVAVIIGRDVYQNLRIDDRQQLRSLQQRIFAAVQQPEDELSIRRLWMDIQSSAELLERIHERAELIEHDFELLAGVLSEDEIGEGQRRLLRALEGRDAQVDALLGAASAPEASLREALIELHDRLARHLGREPIAQPTGGVEMIAW